MEQQAKKQIAQSIQDFQLPLYTEIPNVGLFLEQTTKFVSEYFATMPGITITSSMISNYVKKGLIASPVKKQYSRDQIAYLIFIAICKSVLSLDALDAFLRLQRQSYPLQRAYDYFVREFESLLLFTFELTDTADMFPETSSDGKRLLYTCIIAAVQKVYLEKYLEALTEEKNE